MINPPRIISNEAGDVIVSRGEHAPVIFIRSCTEQVVLRDRVAITMIAMLVAAQADFRERRDAPPGLDFVIEFLVRRTNLRVAFIHGQIRPNQSDWLMQNYDLICVGNKIHLLHQTAGASLLTGAIKLTA